MDYEPNIGLEVHVQLGTETKIFCGCSAAYGARANTQTCPVCLGLPGALPVLNRTAVEYALRLVLAVGGEVQPVSVFARKNYFYPDLPKGYQISQFERPLGTGGVLTAEHDGERLSLDLIRLHLEEDAGKSMHAEGASALDLNRCGVPLVEVVTSPYIRSPEHAARFMQALRQLVRYLGICDGNMEEGSLRCDANVSVRPRGDTRLGTKTEVKNMNSFKAVERALRFEIDRQINLVSHGRPVVHETLLWDERTGRAAPMRGKEESLDYRYFPEPDLVPLRVEYEWLAEIKKSLPELPAARRARLEREHRLPAYDAELLTAERAVADYFEATVGAFPDAKTVSNWIMGEVLRYLRELQIEISAFPVTPAALAGLLRAVESGQVSSTAAKEVLAAMVRTVRPAAALIEELGLAQVSDDESLVPLVRQVLLREASHVAEYRAGKEKVFGFLVGQVMRAARGRANPGRVHEVLRALLAEGEP
jgi:aspartyl-tRNA(Asn)/glutamyl-tRNA(Gln) amidotransferase subunit B